DPAAGAGEPAGGGGGGGPGRGRRRGGGGGGAIQPNQPQPNPAADNTVASATHSKGAYKRDVKIPDTNFARDYKFSEDVGNVGPKATLVATAIVKDGVVTQVN